MEARTATSTFTQLLSSDLVSFKFKFNVALRPQRLYGGEDGYLYFHTAP